MFCLERGGGSPGESKGRKLLLMWQYIAWASVFKASETAQTSEKNHQHTECVKWIGRSGKRKWPFSISCIIFTCTSSCRAGHQQVELLNISQQKMLPVNKMLLLKVNTNRLCYVWWIQIFRQKVLLISAVFTVSLGEKGFGLMSEAWNFFKSIKIPNFPAHKLPSQYCLWASLTHDDSFCKRFQWE